MTDISEVIRLESMRQYGFGIEVMKNTKVCALCGAMASAADIMCKECHSRLPGDTLFNLYRCRHNCCNKCGTVVAGRARFCPQCGFKIQ
ncbi:MAG: zinc ribbon domain-containing protein [Clostridia bacterium]|nr:zinc ribbon domain-containing protein [Clostridia bacterium]